VTHARYRHYRRVLALLNAMDDKRLPEEPRRLLEELAEDLLLSRSTDDNSVHATRVDVELTVGELTAIGVLSRATGVELTRLLLATGPAAAGEDSCEVSLPAA
jgi:hypothetical protein